LPCKIIVSSENPTRDEFHQGQTDLPPVAGIRRSLARPASQTWTSGSRRSVPPARGSTSRIL